MNDKLNYREIEILMGMARRNRENSAALAQIPEQRWKESHKKEVALMDRIIEKLEAMKADAR